MGNSNTIQIAIEIDDKGGVKVLRQIGKESETAGKKGTKGFRTMSKSVGAFNKQINLTHGLATKLGTAFGLWKLYQVAEGFHEVVVEAERTQAMLEGLYGSAQKGRAAFGWIMDLDVPFGLDAIQDSFVKFRSVGIDPTTGSLEALLAGVAAFGGTDEVLKRASIAIQQMAGKGVISMEELRQQLGEAIPTAIPVMAEQLGMTVREMVDIISKGELEASRGLDAFFTGMAAKYGDATDRMMNTWGGMTRKMSKEWTAWRIQVMESGPFQVMKERLGDLLTEIDRLKKNGQLDIWAADMADGVLASVDLMMAGFETLSDVVYGFRAVFGILAEKWYSIELNDLEGAIRTLEGQLDSTLSKIFMPRTDAERAAIEKEIQSLKDKRGEYIANKQAAQDMIIPNIQKMDEYGQKIQNARAKLAQLRADMQARRGERPETDTDLSVPGKPAPIPAPDTKALKEGLKLEEQLWEYEVKAGQRYDDALLDAHEAMIDYEKTLYEEAAKNKIDMTAKMYADLRFSSDDYYAYQFNQLQRQADDYETFTGNAALAHLWLTEQIKALDKERLEADQKNNVWLVDMSERTSDAMEDNFSRFYRDFFRGELDSAADYFQAFCYSLTDSFSDMLGQMTKEWLFGGGSSGGSGWLSSLFSRIGSWFGGGTSLDASAGLGADWAATEWHGGGRVGKDNAPMRTVPASIFTNAPRLHEGYPGLGKDEFPSILKYDETVLPAGVKPVNNVQNLTISVPFTIEGQKDERFASKLAYEIEETARRVLREETR